MNLLAMRLGPGKHLNGRNLMGGVKPEEFTYLHEMIINQELGKMSGRSFGDGLQGGMVIGLPPVMNFGRPPLREKVMAEVLSGEKTICLAVSEAFAGSDVAGIQTTCTKSADGLHYVVKYIYT